MWAGVGRLSALWDRKYNLINKLYSSRRSRLRTGKLIKRALTGLEVGWDNAQQLTRPKVSCESV